MSTRTAAWLACSLAALSVIMVTCPVDYLENTRLTDRLGELTDPI